MFRRIHNIQNGSKGFTLIELLVVIAIIGLLSSIALASLNSARVKARSAKKISDINQISKALYLYYDSTNTLPPNPSPCCWSDVNTALGALVTAGYFQTLPQSPDSNPYFYYDYGTYVLVSVNANETYGPGTRGWHCSDAAGGTTPPKYYCVEWNK